jgi:heme-degrading monooxygenase HmoA
MYTVTNRISVPAEDAAQFEEDFAASMRDTLPGVGGLAGSQLLRLQKERGVYLSVMDFESQADFTAWTRSESFARAHATATPQMTNTIEIFDTVESIHNR